MAAIMAGKTDSVKIFQDGMMTKAYKWRDPARCSKQRLAELEANDRPDPPDLPEPAGMQTLRERQFQRFCELRNADMNIWHAAVILGIQQNLALRFERERKNGLIVE
jgi:hypothetical protein